jgi:bifunctional DNA-binding transcriptional regulator/antitoxin component of YhaV-PrlF toxin-antitoxin module
MSSSEGYSGTPLLKKLGIKPGSKILLINQPDDYFELLQSDITDQLCKKNDTADLIHLFVKNNKEFEGEMKKLSGLIKTNPAVIIWISWYKKSSRIPTDITEDVIRQYALNNGLVDVKVCAVSDIWSGLKLVVPVKLRQKHGYLLL